MNPPPIKPAAGAPPMALLLLVDDQPNNLALLRTIFKHDYEVCLAGSGAEALRFCLSRTPDLVLLDIAMPGMDGYAVCRQLRHDAATRHVPVVFVTASDSPVEQVRALEAGAVDFITKPFHVEVTKARVRAHIAGKFSTDTLRLQAMHDGLTGAANRRHFDDRFALEWRRCTRAGQLLFLIMIDIDFFKRYNDHYGHPAGDACLRQVAQCLARTASRPQDLLARYGGEEFACLLPAASLAGARRVAEAMEQAVRVLTIAHAQSDLAAVVTISAGVAGMLPSAASTMQALVGAADAQLYQAKRSGRGRVCCLDAPHVAQGG